MQRLLCRAHHVTQIARDKGIPVSERLVGLIHRRYDRIITAALDFHEAQLALQTLIYQTFDIITAALDFHEAQLWVIDGVGG